MAVALTPLVEIAQADEIVKAGSTPAEAADLVRKGLVVTAPSLQFACNVLLALGMTEDEVAQRVQLAMGMDLVAKHGGPGLHLTGTPQAAHGGGTSLEGVIADWYQEGMEDPDWAENSCRVTSEAFVRELHRIGLDGETLGLWRGSTYHQVALVGDTVVDWTAHQFGPEPVPVVEPLDEYLAARNWEPDRTIAKHGGPGPHRSTRTPQSIHGVRGSVSALFRRARAGGFTFSVSGRRYPATGYAVAVAGNSFITPASSFTPDLLISYLDTHSAKFSASPALHLGGWYDSAHDEMVLDLVEVFDNQDEAVQAGISRDEQAIFDLANGIEIPTHGSGGRHG